MTVLENTVLNTAAQSLLKLLLGRIFRFKNLISKFVVEGAIAKVTSSAHQKEYIIIILYK